jgi:hypothetical protein
VKQVCNSDLVWFQNSQNSNDDEVYLMSEWPIPYLVGDNTHSPPNPNWHRKDVYDAGVKLALAFLAAPKDVAEPYRSYAYDGKTKNTEHVTEFAAILQRPDVYPQGDYGTFNSNDFANVHHVAWLLIGEALASLTNQNPHGDWGNPPANGTFHFEDDDSSPRTAFYRGLPFYHYVPNATGYYAVGTTDPGLESPNTGV